MNSLLPKLVAGFLLFTSSIAFAQSYEYKQGYIFTQRYIKRISLAQAEKIAASPHIFDKYLSWKWGVEKINDAHIRRIGDRLFVDFKGKAPLSLRDFSSEPSSQGEGDSQQFQYLSTTSGHHIIGVIFGHDQPAFLLIPESGRDIYFVDTN